VSAHAAGSAEDTGALGTGKAAPIHGGLNSECVTGIPQAVVLQNDRSERICKHK